MAVNEKLERLLDELQVVTARKVELCAKAEELQGMIDVEAQKQEILRNDIMSLFGQGMEEQDPNSVPVGEPPVTDLDSVMESVKKGKGWALKARNARKVRLQNLITKEERDFESKTAACRFLEVSVISLDRAIKGDGRIKDWTVTVATPTA